jgi:hypothetical protein
MNVTNHALDRYVERIIGITDMTTGRQHINSNREKIVENVNKMVEHAQLICTMQINGDKSTKNYWLRDNIVLVTDTANTTIITLYRIDFGFDEEIDRVVTDSLLEKIKLLKIKLESKKETIADTVSYKETELSNVESEIINLKERLFMLDVKKNTLQSEIKVVYNDAEMINKEIEVHALKICNSAEYKKDLLKLNVGK